MSTINYTYYVTIGALETQVYPSGDWSLKIAKAEEEFSFCKDYRIKFDGEFIFSGDDYLTLIIVFPIFLVYPLFVYIYVGSIGLPSDILR